MASYDDTDPIRGTDPTRRDSLTRTTEDLKATATQATDTAKQKATNTLNENRKTAADEIEGMAHAARTAASDLQEQDRESLSQYITELANSVSTLASGLRKKSVDELMHDAESIARKNPALFIGGSIAVGLGIARFAKASSHRHHETHTSSSARADVSEPKAEPSLPTGFTTAEGMGRTKSTGNGNGLGNSSDNGLGGARYE